MEYLHRAAGKFQLFAADKDVDQHRGDGIEHADDDPGEDNHFDERLRASLHVVDVHRDGFRAASGHKDPGGYPEERPVKVGDHRIDGNRIGRLYATHQRRARQ
ncbi:hypothetical protein D3C86_1817390 [compost metagenome]